MNNEYDKYDYQKIEKILEASKEKFNKENSKEFSAYNSNLNKNFDDIDKKYCVSFPGELELKKKQMSNERILKLYDRMKIILFSIIVLGGTIMFVDVAKHPENYVTTSPNFEGHVTFSEIIERTPENFGIGGR